MKKRRVIFLLFVLLFSVKVYAPNLSNKDIEQSIWKYQRELSKLRVQENTARELGRYLKAIGYSESGNNPEAWNRYGYIGKYQFGHTARKSCGYGEVKFRDFIRNPSIWSEEAQDSAMITLMSKNESHLRDIIHRYNGKEIRGIIVTKSGILAAAHLGGAGGVKGYFYYGKNPRDAYGTGIEDYLVRFSGFEI